MDSLASITDWMDALISATHELAATSLGFSEGAVLSKSSTLPEVSSGSCIALIGDKELLQIGLAATRKDSIVLARALFGMEAEEEDPCEQDMADAMGEIANVLAGGVKIRMAERSTPMSMGLPIVLRGPIGVAKMVEVAVTVIRWDAAEGQLVLMRQKRGS